MNANKKQTWLPVIFTLILILGMVFGYKLRDDMGDFTPGFLKSSSKDLYEDAIRLIEKKYVDTIQKDSLETVAIKSFLQSLDPYSDYTPLIANQTAPAKIATDGIDSAVLLKPTIGYIRISEFTEKTYETFMKQIEVLNQSGMQQLILDLSNNKGGIIEEAVEISDEFIESNKIIATVKGKAQPDKSFITKRPGQFEKGKLAVIINEHTASAAELLAAALQDYKRATIIGKNSGGNAFIQESFTLKNGSIIQLSVARFYTSQGRCLQPSDTGRLKPEIIASDVDAIQQSLEWLKR